MFRKKWKNECFKSFSLPKKSACHFVTIFHHFRSCFTVKSFITTTFKFGKFPNFNAKKWQQSSHWRRQFRRCHKSTGKIGFFGSKLVHKRIWNILKRWKIYVSVLKWCFWIVYCPKNGANSRVLWAEFDSWTCFRHYCKVTNTA